MNYSPRKTFFTMLFSLLLSICSTQNFNLNEETEAILNRQGSINGEYFIFDYSSDRPGYNSFCISNAFGDRFTFNSLKLYNRYGNLVYKSNDVNESWDGSSNGKKSEAGVYTYLLEIFSSDCLNGKHIIKGDITSLN